MKEIPKIEIVLGGYAKILEQLSEKSYSLVRDKYEEFKRIYPDFQEKSGAPYQVPKERGDAMLKWLMEESGVVTYLPHKASYLIN